MIMYALFLPDAVECLDLYNCPWSVDFLSYYISVCCVAVIPTLFKADAIGTLIEKFLNPEINLSPNPVLNNDGSVKLPAMDNHSMGTVFEELVRKFNEDNNEEAGEHWTPRDAVKLMANLIFLPIADKIQSGSYQLYDAAAGTGGMLTLAEETLLGLTSAQGKQVKTYLFGQEINPETYAICKADMLMKGEGENADHIVGGAEWSTLAHDAFPAKEFDFMLSNPPYGKSWKKDLEDNPEDFNSYGSRRGNHEMMVRGTFANIRIKNLLVPGVEGGITMYLAHGECEGVQMSIYDAAMRYQEDSVPLLVVAGPRKAPLHERVFFFMAHMNLTIVFLIILILSLWRWW
ncbi:MAG: N-6 DNA methylase [Verrucomicrobia bacterium]|nr:N-6 DNA methylase [Deltaproteobacteria bacterium]